MRRRGAGVERRAGAVDVGRMAARQRGNHRARRRSTAISRTASASASDAIGNPASMMSTPSSVELPRHPELLVDAQREAGRLLAVAQRRVENGEAVVSHSVLQ